MLTKHERRLIMIGLVLGAYFGPYFIAFVNWFAFRFLW